PPRSSLFPYTTLFRSRDIPCEASHKRPVVAPVVVACCCRRPGADPGSDLPAGEGEELVGRRGVGRRRLLRVEQARGAEVVGDERSEEHTSELQSRSDL